MLTIALLAGLLMPPAPYDYEPRRPYAVRYAAPEVIAVECRGLDLMVAQLRRPDTYALGCTDLGTMTIWIDNSLGPEDRAKVLGHEKAHVNGWRHH